MKKLKNFEVIDQANKINTIKASALFSVLNYSKFIKRVLHHAVENSLITKIYVFVMGPNRMAMMMRLKILLMANNLI